MNHKSIKDLSNRIDNLSLHLINCKQKDYSAKRAIRILINRKNRLIKWIELK